MPTQLEELVEFLHHGNTNVRQIAAESLVGYSISEPSLFKYSQLEPVKDLKLLVKDYPPIAKDALTILINISEDAEVLKYLVGDDDFLETLVRRVTDSSKPDANLVCELFANLAKSSAITKLLSTRSQRTKLSSLSPIAIDQLLDCFVQGSADYDYLSYLFAELARHEDGRKHLLTPCKEDSDIIPITKLIVFTEHKSSIRRLGVANTIKNVCFDVSSHSRLLKSEGEGGIGLLPYIILPLMGSEEYSEEDTDGMLDECQLLPPDKEREKEADILVTHLESLLLLTTERESRDKLRAVKLYPILRELHLQVEDEGLREGCDRLVQVLMRDEEGEVDGLSRVHELKDNDEDEQIVDVL